jgi:hypothetical protein
MLLALTVYAWVLLTMSVLWRATTAHHLSWCTGVCRKRLSAVLLLSVVVV